MRSSLPAALLAALALAAPASAELTSCEPVRNPYPDTRYEGIDLTGIRAAGVTCDVARRVARRAHRKALGLPVSEDGVRRFSWRAWRVIGDLSGAYDRYVARRDGAVVRWTF